MLNDVLITIAVGKIIREYSDSQPRKRPIVDRTRRDGLFTT